MLPSIKHLTSCLGSVSKMSVYEYFYKCSFTEGGSLVILMIQNWEKWVCLMWKKPLRIYLLKRASGKWTFSGPYRLLQDLEFKNNLKRKFHGALLFVHSVHLLSPPHTRELPTLCFKMYGEKSSCPSPSIYSADSQLNQAVFSFPFCRLTIWPWANHFVLFVASERLALGATGYFLLHLYLKEWSAITVYTAIIIKQFFNISK